MEFEENGNIATHPHDNEVIEVLVSAGTRDMAKGRDVLLTEEDLREEIKAAKKSHEDAGLELQKLQFRLSELNGAIRGRRLSQDRYLSLCAEQTNLKKRIPEAIAALRLSKQKIRDLHVSKGNATIEERLESIERHVLLILSKLEGLEK